LIIVLVLIFEIIDSKDDDPNLFTVPQKIGIAKTKLLGFLLLIPFYFLEFFKISFDTNQLFINILLIFVTGSFCFLPMKIAIGIIRLSGSKVFRFYGG